MSVDVYHFYKFLRFKKLKYELFDEKIYRKNAKIISFELQSLDNNVHYRMEVLYKIICKYTRFILTNFYEYDQIFFTTLEFYLTNNRTNIEYLKLWIFTHLIDLFDETISYFNNKNEI